MIKAVLFDFDGVLTLDETGSQSICHYITLKTGIDKNIFKNEYKKYNRALLTGRVSHEAVWPKICGAIQRPLDIQILYDSFINTPINGEMLTIAAKIKAMNRKIAMVTDNKADRIKRIVAYHHWESLFDFVAISAEIGSGKDREDIFRATVAALAVHSGDCVFIDNKNENLIIPQRMGMETIFFNHWDNDIRGLKQKLTALGITSSMMEAGLKG